MRPRFKLRKAANKMSSNSSVVDERTCLLADRADSEDGLMNKSSNTSTGDENRGSAGPAILANRLYVSHFLSTWNSRVFEFGAVLYLATIFPGTLLPMSVYALTRGASAVLFSPAVGQYIDTSNRLKVVRLSIGKPSSHVPRHSQLTERCFCRTQSCNDSWWRDHA